jgi:hypothetical protein
MNVASAAITPFDPTGDWALPDETVIRQFC